MTTDIQNKPSVESPSDENAAISAALSIHYIVLFFYGLGSLVSILMIVMTALSRDTMGIFNAISLLVPLLFSLHFLAVKGLKKEKRWGYNISWGLGFLLLPVFPFGSVLGIILMSQLSKFRFNN